MEHGYDWDGTGGAEVIGNHLNAASNGTKCNICHVYADTPYTTLGWGGGNSHGNGSLEMNSTMVYNATSYNCASHCHFSGGNTNHNLEDSQWPVRSLAGPTLACYSCHGDGSAAYWPNGSPGSYPDRAGAHNTHITKLAAKLTITLPGSGSSSGSVSLSGKSRPPIPCAQVGAMPRSRRWPPWSARWRDLRRPTSAQT